MAFSKIDHSIVVHQIALLPLTRREGYEYTSQDFFSTRPPEAISEEKM